MECSKYYSGGNQMQFNFGICNNCSIILNSENASQNGTRNGKKRYRKECKVCNSKRVIQNSAKDIMKRRARMNRWVRLTGKVKMYPCEKCSQPCYKKYKRAFCSDKCRFLSYATITETCWIWNGAKNKGYGLICFKDNPHMPAHRVSYILFRGEIPEGKLVCHNCPDGKDNPSCVNPDHLWIGTTQQNSKDSVKKGRSLKGELHNKAKLTEKDVLEIRRLHKEGIKQTKIAEMFNVLASYINCIIKKRTWKHI